MSNNRRSHSGDALAMKRTLCHAATLTMGITGGGQQSRTEQPHRVLVPASLCKLRGTTHKHVFNERRIVQEKCGATADGERNDVGVGVGECGQKGQRIVAAATHRPDRAGDRPAVVL